MPRRKCPRHGAEHPCTCAMGNLYRFVEPVLLFLLKKKGRSYGYELAAELREHALTDASIEAAALYKTLRQLEQNDCVTSEWDVTGKGPAKRVYCLTPHGEDHLVEWITVLDHVARSMTRFVRTAGKPSSRQVTRRPPDSSPPPWEANRENGIARAGALPGNLAYRCKLHILTEGCYSADRDLGTDVAVRAGCSWTCSGTSQLIRIS